MPNPYYADEWATIHQGDCRKILAELPDQSVQTCVTSPPYFGLRDYGCEGQIGLEQTPDAYVAQMVAVFREVRRILKDTGTLWLNIGDSYASGPKNRTESQATANSTLEGGLCGQLSILKQHNKVTEGLKPKDLIGIAWMLAFALRADGWYLRQDIIWHKPAPMPESVKDRCTKAHEYIFLLSKSDRYYFDADAIADKCTESTIDRLSQDVDAQAGSDPAHARGKTNGPMKACGGSRRVNGGACFGKQRQDTEGTGAQSRTFDRPVYDKRNKRSVWTVASVGYPGAHFATFPPKLIEPCIMAGAKFGDTVLDPFNGSGTTGEVARRLNCKYVGIELNPAYCDMTINRLRQGALFGAATC